jgi:integrase
LYSPGALLRVTRSHLVPSRVTAPCIIASAVRATDAAGCYGVASILQTGPKAWRAQVRRKGHKAITRTFTTRRLAEQWARRVESDIEQGKTPESASGLTVRQAIEAFRELRDTGQRPIRAGSTEHYMLRHLDEGLGPTAVDRLTPQVLATWARTRMDEGAGPATVAMEVSKLGTVLRHAGTWLHRPLPDVVTPARPLLEYSGLVGPTNQRDRRPTDDELARLLAAAHPVLADLIRLALLTTMRRGELVRILWSDVDRTRRLVMIRDRKHPRRTTGNHQWCPLLGDALAIIDRQPKVDDRIFPVSPEWVSDSFLTLCKTADPPIVDLHFHDLRHEGTSRLFEAGHDIPQVALVTGHRRWEHLRRYANLRPESLTASPADAAGPGARPRPDNLPSGAPGPGTSGSEIDPR